MKVAESVPPPFSSMERAIILIGMMGAGKSAVGRRLAALLDREFMDTDLMLTNKLGRPIPQLFKIYGEVTFRDHETSLLRSLEPSPVVLATGGGILTRAENLHELKRLGTTVYLRATPETLISRLEISKKKRPLLEVENWQDRLRNLLASRIPMYSQADTAVDVDGLDVDSAALAVADAVRGSYRP